MTLRWALWGHNSHIIPSSSRIFAADCDLESFTSEKKGPPRAMVESVVDIEKSQATGLGGLRITFEGLLYHVSRLSRWASLDHEFSSPSAQVPSNKNSRERAYLLNGLNGWFNPNEMSALMGPSGSGKTTLLDLLAGRKNAGVIEGEVKFGSQKPSMQFLRKYTGYVEQFDSLLPSLTVEEMLLYTSELKRPMSEPMEAKRAAVQKVLKKLALDSCKDVRIGSQMAKGISGGQAKRTNIGIALITNPRVLFLDEPTSGLDSYTSNEVMTFVKSLLTDGVTIVATIHSPTQYCFSLFDSLTMLVRGRLVYFGSIKDAPAFALLSCPNVKEKTAGYNDAEFLVDLITEADHSGKGNAVADYYDQSELKRENDLTLKSYKNSSTMELSAEVQAELSTNSSTVTPWWHALWTLTKYRTTRDFQSPDFLGARIPDKIVIGLMIMTLYLGIGNNFAPNNLINICAVLFMFVVMPAFGAAAYTPTLVMERSLFVRERNDGLYYVITYLLHKMIGELLIGAFISLGSTAFVFYGIKLQGSWGFFWITYYVTLCIGIVLAYLVASFSPNLEVANALLPTYVVTLLFYAGFLFRIQDIPPWWYWYSCIDFLRYSFGALMLNQFEGKDPSFADSTLLGYYSFAGADKYRYLGFLALFFLFFFLMTWFTMSVKRYQSR